MKIRLTEEIWKEGNMYVSSTLSAWCRVIPALVVVLLFGMPDLATGAAIGLGDTNVLTVTHTSGFGQTDGFSGSIPPAPSTVLQYDNTLSDGNGNTSSGAAGTSYILQPFLVGLNVTADTGLSQNATMTLGDAAAVLLLEFDIDWVIDEDGYGPGTEAIANFPLILGTVSDGGFVYFEYEATFTGTPGGILGGELSGYYFNNTPGDFTTSLFENLTNNNGVTGEGEILLTGFIDFLALDGDLGPDAFSGIYLGEAGGIVSPIPASVWLFASGLGVLGWIRRRKASTT